MRILYWSFSLIVLLIALALPMHSWLLFGVYAGAFPITLLLIWYLQKTSRAKQEIASTEQASESVAQDPQAAKKVRRTFWKKLLMVFVAPVCCVAIVLISEPLLTHLPEYTRVLIALLVLVTWGVLLSGLWSVTRTLLFRRSETNFSRWSLLGGVMSACVLIVSVLAPVILFIFLMSGGTSRKGRELLAGPNSFKIDQSIKFTIGSTQPEPVNERYEIQPRTHYAITGIEEIESRKISAANIEKLEKFEAGKFENAALEGMLLNFSRALTAKTENIGLLRSKMTFSLPEITLQAQDLKRTISSAPDSTHQFVTLFPVSQSSEFHSKVEIQMPKNSFLASTPKGDLTSLPDKDILTLSFSRVPDEVEVYYLRRAQLKIVRSILGESSNHDLVVSLLVYLFAPVTVIMGGVFQKKLADSILGFPGRLFRKKSKRTIGFHP